MTGVPVASLQGDEADKLYVILSGKAGVYRDEAGRRTQLATPTPELAKSQQQWELRLQQAPAWRPLLPAAVSRQSGKPAKIEAGDVLISEPEKQYTYTLEAQLGEADAPQQLTALQLETVPDASLPGGPVLGVVSLSDALLAVLGR